MFRLITIARPWASFFGASPADAAKYCASYVGGPESKHARSQCKFATLTDCRASVEQGRRTFRQTAYAVVAAAGQRGRPASPEGRRDEPSAAIAAAEQSSGPAAPASPAERIAEIATPCGAHPRRRRKPLPLLISIPHQIVRVAATAWPHPGAHGAEPPPITMSCDRQSRACLWPGRRGGSLTLLDALHHF